MDIDEATVTAEQAADLVVRTIQAHADSLLRVARRHSLCADDAQDAYQRAIEIFMRRAATVHPDTAGAWLRTVVKHEAMAVRASRLQLVGSEDVDMDTHVAGHVPSPEEQLLSFDMVTRSAEALQRLKPPEVRALWLKAAGHSYEQIAETTGWTYTKVNRAISEGRKAFLARYAAIEAGEECERWLPVVSAMIDGEATAEQVVQARPHLRNCSACRALMREADQQRASFALLFPTVLGSGAAAEPAARAADPGGFLVRVYEAVASTVHERAVASALKMQAALDAVTAGKVAAVAASAAAVAGGGAAVVDKAVDARDSRPGGAVAHRAPAAADGAARDVAKSKRPAPGRSERPGSSTPRGSAASREFGSSSRRRDTSVSDEFGGADEPTASAASAPAGGAATPSPPPRVRRPSQVDAEFGP